MNNELFIEEVRRVQKKQKSDLEEIKDRILKAAKDGEYKIEYPMSVVLEDEIRWLKRNGFSVSIITGFDQRSSIRISWEEK